MQELTRCGNLSKMGTLIKAALIDLSGTLHIEDTVVPGAPEALKRYYSDQLFFCLLFIFLYHQIKQMLLLLIV